MLFNNFINFVQKGWNAVLNFGNAIIDNLDGKMLYFTAIPVICQVFRPKILKILYDMICNHDSAKEAVDKISRNTFSRGVLTVGIGSLIGGYITKYVIKKTLKVDEVELAQVPDKALLAGLSICVVAGVLSNMYPISTGSKSI